ncbi:GNAT family N-acetyltransferase [Marinomonas sp. S3726]|uniref:GNAT family N-acetyltransferase n=1 Tax=Marinomonas sp. S3726 TaxID=579484 RepID=UPI00192E6519|nr:GNAT family N-acetyltransferase [Marinomonas sp. S3726]
MSLLIYKYMIRYARKEDASNLAVLSLRVWLDTYAIEGIKANYSEYVLSQFTPAYFELLIRADSPCMDDKLIESPYRILVFEQEGVLKGYILINLASHFDDNSQYGFEIEKLYVDTKFKGLGIGRSLIDAVKQNFGHLFWLYTWVENESNRFYTHLGFKQIGQFSFSFSEQLIENNVYHYSETADIAKG